MSVIRHDFLPADLAPLLEQNGLDGCVAVQADQSEEETLFLLDLAEQHAFVRGVVGWVDLRSPRLSERLEYFAQFPKIKGFRHILQGEKPAFMLDSDFLEGIAALKRHHFTYDVLVFPRHLEAVHTLLKKNENQPFIIDHLAKPYIKKGLIKQWAKDLRRLARYDHVYCKLSGMVTEADWQHWRPTDLHPYLEIALEAFGPQRLCYGSDWPVCLLAATYAQQVQALQSFTDRLTASEQAAIWGGNALKFYQLSE